MPFTRTARFARPSVVATSFALALGAAACDDAATTTSSSGATSTSGAGGATSSSVSTGDTSSSSSGVAAPGLVLLDYGLAIDVTPDGATAVFEDISTLDAKIVFYDTVANTAVEKTSVGDPTRDLATGVSQTGRVSALYGDPVVAGYWTEATGWATVASPFPQGCDQDLAAAWDVSAAGDVVVGMAWNGCAPEGFLWKDSGGAGTYQKLAVLGAPTPGGTLPPTNRATVVSDDGKVVAGFAQNGNIDRTPARWTADGAGMLLPLPAADTPGEVLSIDATGATLAGSFGGEGFVWTEASGLTLLPRLEGSLPSDFVFPNAMSGDGALVFGGVGDAFFSIPIAFVWSAADGIRALADVATKAGVTVPSGVLLNSVLGASADGTVLIGTAMDAQGMPKTFVLRLPAAP